MQPKQNTIEINKYNFKNTCTKYTKTKKKIRRIINNLQKNININNRYVVDKRTIEIYNFTLIEELFNRLK